jgi:Ser/Thr protein kinase RdoA (MazF antagonist)
MGDSLAETRAIATAWSLPAPLTFRPVRRGINNLTQFVDTPGDSYVLRIYQNTREVARGQCEHAILLAVHRQALSFGVPTPFSLRCR